LNEIAVNPLGHCAADSIRKNTFSGADPVG
jgi:hypothetical protein